MTIAGFQQTLDRSSVRLNPTIRTILSEGRTMRCRNRDGEYATVMADRIQDELADGRADYIIAITNETFADIAAAPTAVFFADVYGRDSRLLGEIRVMGPVEGSRGTTLGWVPTTLVSFSDLRAGDLFSEREADEQGRAVVFRATSDATADGAVQAVVEGSGEVRSFDLGADYLAFKVLAG